MQKYKIEEQQRIETNKRIISDTISKSYKLNFHAIRGDQNS